MNNNLITTDELSKILKVSRSTIGNYRKEGMPCIKVVRTVRFDKEEVLKWLKNNCKS